MLLLLIHIKGLEPNVPASFAALFEFSVNNGCRSWLFQLKAIGLSLRFLCLLPPTPDFSYVRCRAHGPQALRLQGPDVLVAGV